MRNELSHIEAIENYLNGTMSQSDRADFEMKMNEDLSFQEDVELQKSITDRIQFLAFKAEAISSHASLVSSQKAWWKKGLFLNSFLVLIACAIAFFIVMQFDHQSNPVQQTTIDTDTLSLKEDSVIAEEILTEEIIPEELNVANTYHSKSKKEKPHLAFQQPFEKAILNATVGGTIITKDSKSSIHFDPNSLVDKNGKIVQGDVEIRYREYRNSAEMAFSGIPMRYEDSGNEYRFNSAGMIEVRAYQNDEALSIKPGADFTIDYNVTQQVDSCYFFALDDEKQTWEKKQRIDFDSLNAANLREAEPRFWEDSASSVLLHRGMLQGRVDLVVLNERREQRVPPVTINLYYPKDYYRDKQPSYQKRVDGVIRLTPTVSKDSAVSSNAVENTGNAYAIEFIDSGRYVAEIGCDGCDDVIIDTLVIYGDRVSELDASLSMLLEDNMKNWRRYVIFGRKKRQMKEQWKPSTYVLKDSIMRVDRWDNSARKKESDSLAGVRAGLLNNAKSMLVSGLRCENFGVYNCDQIKLVKDQITVRPKFVDGKGIAILGIYLLSMIDLNINAAFSFSPFEFKSQRGGKTVILAFTMDRFYAISADEFAAMNIQSNGNYTIKMQDITDQVKTTDDLKNYLGL